MKLLKKLFVVAAATMMFASCSDEQSTFDIENVPGRALVQGVVNCNYGANYVNGKLEYEIKPVANLTVLLTIKNNEYQSGLTGTTVLETVTNENGEYSFEVPVTLSGLKGEISTAQFKGVRTVVERKNNKVVTSEQNVVFGAKSTEVALDNYGIMYQNLMCNVTSTDESVDTYAYYASIKGTIGKNIELYTAPHAEYNDYGNMIGVMDGVTEKVFTGAANVDLIIRTKCNDNDIVFNATTNSMGVFTIDVPVIGFPADIKYSVEIMPVETTFTTYVRDEEPTTYKFDGRNYNLYAMTAHTIKGMYSQTIWSTGDNTLNFLTGSYAKTFEMKGLLFTAFPEEDVYDYNPYSWSDATPWDYELEESELD